jgi:hypothetical protein
MNAPSPDFEQMREQYELAFDCGRYQDMQELLIEVMRTCMDLRKAKERAK